MSMQGYVTDMLFDISVSQEACQVYIACQIITAGLEDIASRKKSLWERSSGCRLNIMALWKARTFILDIRASFWVDTAPGVREITLFKLLSY
jgi:hypothetical protein